MNLYKDNRDIRDRDYQGNLIVETDDEEIGVTKEEATETIKNILIYDKEDFEKQKEILERKLLYVKDKIKVISERLTEIS